MRSLALRLCSSVSAGEVEAPRRRTVGAFALVVSALAFLRLLLLPPPGGSAVAGGEHVPAHLEEDLVRLVLAEQLEGVANTIQREARTFESIQARRAGALKEIQAFEGRLKASVSELQELGELAKAVHEDNSGDAGLTTEAFEGRLKASVSELQELGELAKAVHEDNSGDAGLTTEVSRAQGRLRELHVSVSGQLDGFKQQLEGQAEAMRGVRDGWAKIGQVPDRTGDRVAAGAVHERLEEKLEQYLEELSSFHRGYEATVEGLSPDVITADDLEVLLARAAEPSKQSGAGAGDGGDGRGPDDEDTVRFLSEEAVHLAIERMARGGGGNGGDDGDSECVSEERLMSEVDEAIRKLRADGTGRRDYANTAVGGKVLTSKGMVSDTYTPPAWWTPSWYWHRAGVENGIVTALSVRVLGRRHKDHPYPVKLGGGVYEIDGRPIQTFPMEPPKDTKLAVIQVKILSNWGNPDYTCLYRVRVHGREN
eukprot:g15066.t1